MKKLFTLLCLSCLWNANAQLLYIKSSSPGAYVCPGKQSNLSVSVGNGQENTSIPADASFTATAGGNNVVTGILEEPLDYYSYLVIDFPEMITFNGTLTYMVQINIPGGQSWSITGNINANEPPVPTIAASGNIITGSNVYAPYKIRYKLNGVDQFNELNDQGASYNFTPSQSGTYTAYSYLENQDDYCTSTISNTLNFTVTSVSESAEINVSVYPNPVLSTINIKTGMGKLLHYELVNSSGIVLCESDFLKETVLNADHLTPGTYVIRVKDDAGNASSYTLLK
jgi:hypothetical protein